MASNKFTIANAIRVMLFGGLLAILFVIVQSCQVPKTGLNSYAKGSLRKLTVLPNPPKQPDLTFMAYGDQPVKLSDYKGKMVLLNVWATWCAPCVVEMPMLSALQDRRGGGGFEVVTISIDRTGEDAEKWLKANGLENLTAFHDGTYSLPGKLQVSGVPISVFYDKQGREIARIPGEVDWGSAEASAFLTAILD